MSNDVTPSPLEGGSAALRAQEEEWEPFACPACESPDVSYVDAWGDYRCFTCKKWWHKGEFHQPRGLSAGEAPCAAAVIPSKDAPHD